MNKPQLLEAYLRQLKKPSQRPKAPDLPSPNNDEPVIPEPVVDLSMNEGLHPEEESNTLKPQPEREPLLVPNTSCYP